MREPRTVRPVFAPEDFKLLATAVLHYIRQIHDKPEAVKFAHLYHRLGRIGDESAPGR